ncbi:MAG: deoxyribodipyrimidine photo-lyase [Pseudomonadales bacterium]
MRTLVWFRNDLRTTDNPALYHAREQGEVVAVFLVAATQWREHDVGDNRFAFLLDNLHELKAELDRLGIPLKLLDAPRFDDAPAALLKLARSLSVNAIAFNEEYPLNERKRDSKVRLAFESENLKVDTWHAGAIVPPGAVLTGRGEPYTVFSPFKRKWLASIGPEALEPLAAPRRQRACDVTSDPVPTKLDGVPRDRVSELWPGGQGEAARRLERFCEMRIAQYKRDRDIPALPGTSQLSPYLSVGAVSGRQCLTAAAALNEGRLDGGSVGISSWISELVWRDFYRHVIALFPHVSRGQSFRPELDALPWRHAPAELAAWKSGQTGYPLVDAAMRQLAETGWMHNRLRMLTAMFLSKHLLLDWRHGERYFMQQLVDGDFAANNGGWQWSASTGTDAAPYFRIFNPFTQAERFDHNAEFIRHWVPELRHVPVKIIVKREGERIDGYPEPIVDHKMARERAIETFKSFQAAGK